MLSLGSKHRLMSKQDATARASFYLLIICHSLSRFVQSVRAVSYLGQTRCLWRQDCVPSSDCFNKGSQYRHTSLGYDLKLSYQLKLCLSFASSLTRFVVLTIRFV